MSECETCRGQRFTPCPMTAIKPIGVCAFCGGQAQHQQMPCRACNKDGLNVEDLAELLGFK